MSPTRHFKTPLNSAQANERTTGHTSTANPSTPSDPNIIELLSDLQTLTSNYDDKPAAKCQKSITLTPEQFERL
jgi:hypothetical protein